MKCKFSDIVFRILLVLYIGVIAFLCFARPEKLPEVQRSFLGIPADKIAHFMMFFPLPVIAFFAFGKKNEKKTGPVVASIVSITAFSCILAGITEIIQGSLPYRSEDINDFKADCLAIIIAGLAILVYCIIIKKKNHHRK